MEHLNYTPDELREAMRFAREQCVHLCRSHAGNWRVRFNQFIDAMTKTVESLKLLARLLDGHQTVSGSAWFRAAADGKAPPLPADRYERLALVWKLVTLSVQKVNPDGFDAREKVDLPYVLVNSDLPGGSLGEKFEEFRVRYLCGFAEEVDRFGQAVEAALPEGGTVDFWDAALAALAPPGPSRFVASPSQASLPDSAPRVFAAPAPAEGTGAEAGTGTEKKGRGRGKGKSKSKGDGRP